MCSAFMLLQLVGGRGYWTKLANLKLTVNRVNRAVCGPKKEDG